MNDKEHIHAIAMDLKRVAIGYHSGSLKMADRFLEEALKREKLLDYASLSENVKRVLFWMNDLTFTEDMNKRAEDALLYSMLLLSFSK